MRTRVKTRLIIVLLVLIGALVSVAPSLTGPLPGWWMKILPSKAVQLGLDLKGGMELILEVQTDEAVNNGLSRIASDIKTVFKDKKVRLRRAETTGFNRLVVEVRRDRYLQEAVAFLQENGMEKAS